MGLIHHTKKAVGRALESRRAGASKIAIVKLEANHLASLVVGSPAFQPGAELPLSATADFEGDATPPPIVWENVPAGTRSFVLICEDPDAPFPEPFVHWLVYGIPAGIRTVGGGSPRAFVEGLNSTLRTGFTGAAPPPGHGVHHYHFQVFALDCELDLPASTGRGALFNAMRGHVLACGDVVGAYERG